MIGVSSFLKTIVSVDGGWKYLCLNGEVTSFIVCKPTSVSSLDLDQAEQFCSGVYTCSNRDYVVTLDTTSWSLSDSCQAYLEISEIMIIFIDTYFQ